MLEFRSDYALMLVGDILLNFWSFLLKITGFPSILEKGRIWSLFLGTLLRVLLLFLVSSFINRLFRVDTKLCSGLVSGLILSSNE